MPRNPPRPGTGSTVASFSSASSFYDDAPNSSLSTSTSMNHSQSNSSSPPPAPSTGTSRGSAINQPSRSSTSSSSSNSNSNSNSSSNNRTARRSSQRIGKSFEALLASNETWVLKETVDVADDPSGSVSQSAGGGSTNRTNTTVNAFGRTPRNPGQGLNSLSLADEMERDKEDKKKGSSNRKTEKSSSSSNGDGGFNSLRKVLTRRPKWEEEEEAEAEAEREREREELERRRRKDMASGSGTGNYGSIRSSSSTSSSNGVVRESSISSSSRPFASSPGPQVSSNSVGRTSSSSIGGGVPSNLIGQTTMERSPSSSTRASSIASTANNQKFATPPEGTPVGGVILSLPSNGSVKSDSDAMERSEGSGKGRKGSVEGNRLSTEDIDRRRSYLRAGGTASSPDLKTLVSKKMAQVQLSQANNQSPLQGSQTWDTPSSTSSATSYVTQPKENPLPSLPNESPALDTERTSSTSGRSRTNNSSDRTRLPFPQSSSGGASEEGGSIDSNLTATGAHGGAATPTLISVRQPAKSTGATTSSKRGALGSNMGSSSHGSNPPSSSKSYQSETASFTTTRSSGANTTGGGVIGKAPVSLAQEVILGSPNLESNSSSSSGAFKERMKKTSGFLRKLGGGGGSSREREKSASKNLGSLSNSNPPSSSNYPSSVKSAASSSNTIGDNGNSNRLAKKSSQASLAASEPDSSFAMRPQDIAPVPIIPAQYAAEKNHGPVPPPPARGQKSASRKEKERRNPPGEGMGLGIGLGIPTSSISSQTLGRSPSAPSTGTSTSTSIPTRSSSTQIPASGSLTSVESDQRNGTAVPTHVRKASSGQGGSDSSGGELRSALKAWESEMDETLRESAKDLEKKTEFKPRNQWGPSPQLPDLGLDIDLDDSRVAIDGKERRGRSKSFMDDEDSSKGTVGMNSPSSLTSGSSQTETPVMTSNSAQNTPSLRSPGLSSSKLPWSRSKSPAARSTASDGGGKASSSSTPQVSSPVSYSFEDKDYSSTLSPADLPSRKNSTSPSFPGAMPKERASSGSSNSDVSNSLLPPSNNGGSGSGFVIRDQGIGSSLVGGRHLSRKETSSIAASLASFETTPETPDTYSKFYTAGSNFAATWAKEKEEEEKRNRSSATGVEGDQKKKSISSRKQSIDNNEDDESELTMNPEDSIRLIPRRKGSSATSGGKSSTEPEDDQPPTPLDANFISRDSAFSTATSRAETALSSPTESTAAAAASALETITERVHSRDPSTVQPSTLISPAPRSTSNTNPSFRKASLDVSAGPRSSSSSVRGEVSRESSPGPGRSSGSTSVPLHPMERRASRASETSPPSNINSRVPSLGVVDMDNLVAEEDLSTSDEARELAMKCWNEDESFLKKEKISEWLGGIGKVNQAALLIYFSYFDFAGLRIDAAFRKLCDKLFLRAETQQIDRILNAFSQCFWKSNHNSIYGSADIAHSIVFSLLLLNTDLHVADITERMTRNQFVKNTMSAISDQKLADSFTSSAQIGDDSRSNLSVNVTDHDDQTGSMSPSLSGTFSNRTRPTRSGSIRTNRSMSKDPISSGGNNGSTPNLASTVNGGSRSFSASTDDVASPSLSATKSPGKASLPPSATFNSGTRGRNASASIDIDRSRQNVGPTAKAWEAELEMLLKDIYVAVKGDQIRLPSSDRLLSPTLASQRKMPKSGGPGSDRVSALKRGSIRGIQGLLGNSSFASEDALSQTSSSIGSRSLGDSWAFHTTGSASTSPSTGSSLHPPTLGFANTLSHSIIKESQEEDLARSVSSEPEEVDDDELALMGPPWAKEGVLTRKHYWEAPQKRGKDKAWVEVFVVVQKGTLSMFRFGADTSSSKASAGSNAPVGGGNWLSSATSLGNFSLAHALANALPPPGYNRSRPHVLALTLPGGAVYFFQAGHEDLVHEWVSTCNYWAARQSREPLAAGVSNMEYGWNKVMPSQYEEAEDLLDEREETKSVLSGISSPPDGSIYNMPTTPHGPKASDTRSIRSGKSTSARSMRARGAALYQNWHEAASLVTPGGGSGSSNKDTGSIMGGYGGGGLGASSVISSPSASIMSGSGPSSHANERTYINEWKPPVSPTVASTLKEEEQLDRCISQVTRIELELTAHTNLRQPMLGLYGPKSSNGAKALGNWERKSNYLLQELVKYQCYVESLKGAVRMRAEKRGKREVAALLEQADEEMSRVRQDEEGGPLLG